MMGWKKINILLAAVLCLCGVGSRSVSVEAAKNQKVNFSNFTGSKEDVEEGTVEPALSYEKEEDSLRLSFDTDGYEEGYYTATAFKNVKLTMEDYVGLSFEVQNNLTSPARMNFALIDGKSRTTEVGDGFYVKLQGEETSYAKVEYGCFELPAGFEGEVEIPFALLAFGDTGEQIDEITQIWGYGVVCVAGEEEAYDVTLSGLTFLTPEETTDVNEWCMLGIEGEESALRPRVGLSSASYQAVGYNMSGECADVEAVFSLSGDYEQVSLSEDGILTVGSKCADEAVEIRAKTKDGLEAALEIALYDSWTNSISTDNGYDASLADPSEIAPIVWWAKSMCNPNTLWLLRGCFGAGGAAFLGYYLIARRRDRSGK